jgi:hypothetical protein
MKILVLESNPIEQECISKTLNLCNLSYENTAAKAINRLGMEHIDFALVDADSEDYVCSWEDLTSFLRSINIDYAVFSSNGKVGMNNGQKIISIHDLPNVIPQEEISKETSL